MTIRSALIALALVCCATRAARAADVVISIDADKPLGKLRAIWRFFGYDEPNFTYMTDGKRLLGGAGEACAAGGRVI